MTASRWSEDALTESLARRLALDADRGRGIGDDAAQLTWTHGDVVVAKDVIVDGRHFDLARDGLSGAVHKAVAINLSDLAAVGADPDAFLLGAVLPHDQAPALSLALVDALEGVVAAFDVPCVGGDTNVAAGPLVLSVTVLGHSGPHGFVSRAGAQVDDVLSVTGPLGGSLAGRHLRPRPRLEAGRALAGFATAMIDLSDGLSTDLRRLCAASSVGATIEGADVPVHVDVAARDPQERLLHALNDGEDFELLLAHPPLDDERRATLTRSGVSLHTVGRCTPATDGVVLAWRGAARPLEAGGFDHFR